MTHFTDHQGNFLTKNGHKIDDFSLKPNKSMALKQDKSSNHSRNH